MVTFKSAERLSGLAAATPFYPGGYDPKPEDVANVQIPILAFFGDEDHGIPHEQRDKIEKIYKDAGKDYEALVYHGGHAFLNPDHGMGNEEAAAAAWPRAVQFLKDHLQAD